MAFDVLRLSELQLFGSHAHVKGLFSLLTTMV